MSLDELLSTCPSPRRTFALAKFIWCQDQRILSANGTKRRWMTEHGRATWNETRELFRCVMERWKTKCGESRKKNSHLQGTLWADIDITHTHQLIYKGKTEQRKSKLQAKIQGWPYCVFIIERFYSIVVPVICHHGYERRFGAILRERRPTHSSWENVYTDVLLVHAARISFFLLWFIGSRCSKSSFQLFCLTNRRSWAVKNPL